MDIEVNPTESVLKKTFLSQRPQNRSLWTALYFQALIVVITIIDWDNLFDINSLLSASHHQVYDLHEYWRLFTTLGVHHDTGHLVGNALFFIPFAWFLNSYFGFFVFPILSFCAGALINYIVLGFYPSDVSIIGASGVVYFMVAFWLALYIGIERRHSPMQRVLRCMGIVLAELAPQAFDPQISYGSHAVGFALGLILGGLYFLVYKSVYRNAETWAKDEIYDLQ
jgi:rhomboid protease GluP